MSEIALYNTLRKINGVSDDEAKEAVADIANSKDVATKVDLKEGLAELKADIRALKADIGSMKWLLGLLVAMNVAFIVSTVSLLVRFV